jgi:hypothetical protein
VAKESNGVKLAMILRRLRRGDGETSKGRKLDPNNEGTRILWDAVQLFSSLTLAGEERSAIVAIRRIRTSPSQSTVTGRKRDMKVPVARLLEFIFNVWVDKLVYAAAR